MATVRIKRIYDPADKSDGFRILVDRLWPRGVSKEKAALDLWLKEIAPSAELRTWFNHEPEKFKEFSTRYSDELAQNETLDQLKTIIDQHAVVTLLYAAHDPQLNQAIVLQKYLQL